MIQLFHVYGIHDLNVVFKTFVYNYFIISTQCILREGNGTITPRKGQAAYFYSWIAGGKAIGPRD